MRFASFSYRVVGKQRHIIIFFAKYEHYSYGRPQKFFQKGQNHQHLVDRFFGAPTKNRPFSGAPRPRCKILILPRHNAVGSSIVAGFSAIILPAATLWLPESCRQQHRGCHNIAALALILLQGQDCGSHDIADGKIVAATILLPLLMLCALYTQQLANVVCIRDFPLHSVGQA